MKKKDLKKGALRSIASRMRSRIIKIADLPCSAVNPMPSLCNEY